MKVKLIGLTLFLVFSAYIVGLFAQVKDSPSMKKTGLDFYKKAEVVIHEAQKDPGTVINTLKTKEGSKTYLNLLMLLALVGGLVYLNNMSKGARDSRGFTYSGTGEYGTARFMSVDELKSIFNWTKKTMAKGIILGTLNGKVVTLPLNTMLNKHMAIIGPSGSMKSRTFMRNNIMQLAVENQSMVITDPKGELAQDTVPFLKDQDYKVKVYSLVDPVHSDRWNPMEEVHDQLSAQMFTKIVIENTSTDNAGSDAFWDRAEQNLLTALALYVINDPSCHNKNMGTLYDLVSVDDPALIDALFDTLPNSHPAKAPYSIYMQAPEKIRAGVITGLGIRLQVFQVSSIRDMTSTSDICLEDIGKSKTVCFCIISDTDSTLSFLSSLFFSFLFIKLVRFSDSTGKRLNPEVYCLLDEFTNIGRIPDFTRKLATVRSRGINLMMIFQDVSRLSQAYPDNDWKSIFANCDTTLALGFNDLDTAEYFSELIGKTTIEVNSASTEGSFVTGKMVPAGKGNQSKVGRYLLDPSELRRFTRKKAIVLASGQYPLVVNKMDFTKHPLASKLIPFPLSEYIPEWTQFKNTGKGKITENIITNPIEEEIPAADPPWEESDLPENDVEREEPEREEEKTEKEKVIEGLEEIDELSIEEFVQPRGRI